MVALTKGDEVHAEDEDAAQEEGGGLADVARAALEQQQGDDVGGHLDGG